MGAKLYSTILSNITDYQIIFILIKLQKSRSTNSSNHIKVELQHNPRFQKDVKAIYVRDLRIGHIGHHTLQPFFMHSTVHHGSMSFIQVRSRLTMNIYGDKKSSYKPRKTIRKDQYNINIKHTKHSNEQHRPHYLIVCIGQLELSFIVGNYY